MTCQEIFDTVISHLRLQGPCMFNGTIACRYRGSNDTRCAVGALIPDDLYLPSMERLLVPGLIKQMECLGDKYITLSTTFKTHQQLITRLQLIHDNENKSNWEVHWKLTAMSFNLKYSIS